MAHGEFDGAPIIAAEPVHSVGENVVAQVVHSQDESDKVSRQKDIENEPLQRLSTFNKQPQSISIWTYEAHMLTLIPASLACLSLENHVPFLNSTIYAVALNVCADCLGSLLV